MWVTGGGACVPVAGDGSICLTWPQVALSLLAVAAPLSAAILPLVITGRATVPASEMARRAWRHTWLGSVCATACFIGICALFAFSASVAPLFPSGRVIATLPALAGLSLVLTQAVTQATWPRPEGERRVADLTRRVRADVVATSKIRLAIVWLIGVVATSGVFATLASGGRSITEVSGATTSTWSPYPGAYYGVPAVIAALILVLASEVTLKLIVNRAAIAGVSRDWDLALRRRSASHLLTGVQLALAIQLAGLLGLAAIGHGHVGQEHLGVALLAGACAVVACAIWAALPRTVRAILVTPRARATSR